jgi:hypothetical protein
MSRPILLEVTQGDILEAQEDVVALKFAQGFHGADLAVAKKLHENGVRILDLDLRTGAHRVWQTDKVLSARHVLYVGTPRLGEFRYERIRQFGRLVLEIVAEKLPDARSLAMTIHGPGYGLDEAEAMLAQLGGYLDALDVNTVPAGLHTITIYEARPDRAERIWKALARHLDNAPNAERVPRRRAYYLHSDARSGHVQEPPALAGQVAPAGTESEAKPHAFVAMPFAKSMDDVYYYGIVQPVNAAGLLCERVDEASFSGHILDQIRDRIDTAAVVIADLTTANPNVYLEVGYAWGKGKPTILLVQKVEDLRFDLAGQRCLIYERILDLEQSLTKELAQLRQRGILPPPPPMT